jgi:hypothetical protein
MVIAALAVAASIAQAQGYRTEVVVRDLERPTGILVEGQGMGQTLYITQIPTPGVPGSMGGMNSVIAVRYRAREMMTVSMGEPEPVNLASGQGLLMWTCKSAGVILGWSPGSSPKPILTELDHPCGIAVGPQGIFFTQVPTPGLGGMMGGMNTVNLFDGMNINTLSMGEPEPYDIAVAADGTAYWTCTTAGVIVKQTPSGKMSVLLENLNSPKGITIDNRRGDLIFSEVPTPGVPGSMGGMNRVMKYNLRRGGLTVVDEGDPEPTDVTVATDGSIFWTCSSAGVVVRARRGN